MEQLTKQATQNLETLLSLKNNEYLMGKRGELIKSDYISVGNTSELEYSIYFTYHQLFLSMKRNVSAKELYLLLDESINVLYDNEFLNKLLIEDTRFANIIQDIDYKLTLVAERNYLNSPLYYFFEIYDSLCESLRRLYVENKEYVIKHGFPTYGGQVTSSEEEESEEEEEEEEEEVEDEEDEDGEGEDEEQTKKEN
jgi:hypothetical protein